MKLCRFSLSGYLCRYGQITGKQKNLTRVVLRQRIKKECYTINRSQVQYTHEQPHGARVQRPTERMQSPLVRHGPLTDPCGPSWSGQLPTIQRHRDKAAARAPTYFLTLRHSPFPLVPTPVCLGSIHRVPKFLYSYTHAYCLVIGLIQEEFVFSRCSINKSYFLQNSNIYILLIIFNKNLKYL